MLDEGCCQASHRERFSGIGDARCMGTSCPNKKAALCAATPRLQDGASHLVVAVVALEALLASLGPEPHEYLLPSAGHHYAPVQSYLQGSLHFKTQ